MQAKLIVLVTCFLAVDAFALDLELDDKQVLITGSTRGIGYAIAKAMLEEGADVIIE